MTSSPTNIEWIKRQAKKLKQQTGKTHTECLAKQHGFATFAMLVKHVNREP